jgi:hypothetical protein
MGKLPVHEIVERQIGRFDDEWAMGYTRWLITRIVAECPPRLGGPNSSATKRPRWQPRAHTKVLDEMTRLGLSVPGGQRLARLSPMSTHEWPDGGQARWCERKAHEGKVQRRGVAVGRDDDFLDSRQARRSRKWHMDLDFLAVGVGKAGEQLIGDRRCGDFASVSPVTLSS